MATEKLNLPEDIFDCVIIGGGIVGAGVFREQSLHGIKTLLLDQADFNSQTSQGSSKMLHGGIRYLENLDFALVFEALKEKNLWLKLSPGLTKEIPFYLPVYKDSKWPLFFMRMGLFIYDLLSFFKNSPHRVYNKDETLKKIPGLKSKGLTGSGMYYDGIVDDSKLGLECIYDGLKNPRSAAYNYKQVIAIAPLASKGKCNYQKVTYKDTLTNIETIVTTKTVVITTGPFTDQFMKKLSIPWKPMILPSKGTHLWLKSDSLPLKDAMVLQTKDKRIIFVIPQRNAILVGTTEDPVDSNIEMLNIKPTKKEIDYLISVVNEYFPANLVDDSNIISSFSAIRPLVRGHASSSKTSRNHKILNPSQNIYVLIGGKYTTFRKMAQDLNKKIFKNLKIKHDRSLSLKPLQVSSIVRDPHQKNITKQDIEKIIANEHIRTKDDIISRRLSLLNLEQYLEQYPEEDFSNSLKSLETARNTEK